MITSHKFVCQRKGESHRNSRWCPTQRGFVLFIALITAIALAFGASALLRTVATQSAVGANLAARLRSMYAATESIERAVTSLFETRAITDTTVDDLRSNYFATYQTGADSRGVPYVLQTIRNYPPSAVSHDAGEGFTGRYIIERLCLVAGPASVDNCTLSPPDVAFASPSPSEPPRPYYRVTVRIDGPSGATGFVQAMFGEDPSHHRLSWRMLDE